MRTYILLAVMTVFLAVGCKTPNWLVSNDFLGTDKTVKEFYTPQIQAGQVLSNLAGKEDKAQFFNYTVRVCNVDEQGNLTQCMDTVVLEHVMQDTLYRNFAYGM